jgi:hypothetical protein
MHKPCPFRLFCAILQMCRNAGFPNIGSLPRMDTDIIALLTGVLRMAGTFWDIKPLNVQPKF